MAKSIKFTGSCGPAALLNEMPPVPKELQYVVSPMILISIGSNLPGPDGTTSLQICLAAAEKITNLGGLTLIAISSWYRTTPIPNTGQPDFCNGVARFEGEITPLALLDALQVIEASFGRVRSVANAARPIDLDIIDLNGAIRATPAPILPHPRAHLRAFVLRPILDVAPAWRHPTFRQGVSSLLAELPPQGIQPWHDH